ncbi:MAG: NrfD/PsrC family molybdoenzyme membrane anchor subunit [Syntrophothermus sp.]
MNIDYAKELPVVEGNPNLIDIDNVIAKPIEEKANRKFFLALAVSGTALLIGVVCVAVTLFYGIGVWGNNQPVGWGFGIVNFVFWVGIGHAGTLISAILFLLRQKWRTGIARFAEAMTIFAVICAALFPVLHTGRPWLAGYLFPYPNQHGLWVNFTSPLIWDVFAVSTYFTVSLVFWYVGLIPDFAILRDRTEHKLKKTIYSILSLGWRHSHRQWQHYEKAYMLLAGFATPLVLSVHTIVSFDFAVSIIPGWHTTIFPPYFVAGAIFSGFAMVVTVLIFVRRVFHLEHIITLNHLEKMNKVIIATGLMVGYAYGMEFFTAWYSGVPAETFVFVNRAMGPYAWAYWIMISCNVLIPQLFWFKKIRRSILPMFIIVILVNVGMWFERFVIVVTSLSRDFLPSSWGYFKPTIFDLGILLGSFGLFFTLVIIFTKFLPVVSISEIKAVVEGSQPVHHQPTDGGTHAI